MAATLAPHWVERLAEWLVYSTVELKDWMTAEMWVDQLVDWKVGKTAVKRE